MDNSNTMNKKVKAKKHLGQHFLNDKQIAKDIVDSLSSKEAYDHVLEIGPGMGVLTEFLIEKKDYQTHIIDIDKESIVYLEKEFSVIKDRIISADFLQLDLNDVCEDNLAIIGNFPYNISSQIFFKVLDNRNKVPEVVGMIQKEVAERIASKHGNKTYGILSVLLQAYYDIEYLFTVPPHVFSPPPKVESAVIRLKRNNCKELPCNEKFFKRVVKQSFSTRRKTLRNCLKSIGITEEMEQSGFMHLRAEQLSVNDFIKLTQIMEKNL